MNKETLESILKTSNELRDNLLFHPKDFDDKSAWMLLLTFIAELTKYEIERIDSTKTEIYK